MPNNYPTPAMAMPYNPLDYDNNFVRAQAKLLFGYGEPSRSVIDSDITVTPSSLPTFNPYFIKDSRGNSVLYNAITEPLDYFYSRSRRPQLPPPNPPIGPTHIYHEQQYPMAYDSNTLLYQMLMANQPYIGW